MKRLQPPAQPAKPAKKKPRGKPFVKGWDKRRNLKGPAPEVWEVKRALLQDAPAAVEALKKRVAEGSDQAIKYTLDQSIGKPKESLEVSGPGGKPIEVTDARDRLAALLLKRAGHRTDSGRDEEPD